MTPLLTIVDNVSPQANDLREFILEFGNFRTVTHDGHDYVGICPEVPDGMLPIIHCVPGLEDAEIEMHFFRRETVSDPVTSWIHADGGIADTALVWHLSPDPIGGTALFRHRQTGWEAMPTEAQLRKAGLSLQEAVEILSRDSHSEDPWERLMIAPARFNRMVSYPAQNFHGKWPREGFGTTADTARLIYVAFLTR